MSSIFNRCPEHERLVFMLRHQSIFINENTFCQCGIINEVDCLEHFIYYVYINHIQMQNNKEKCIIKNINI